MLDENDIEKRIKALEATNSNSEAFGKTMRSLTWAICIAFLATLGTAYGCNRENARSDVDKAKFGCVEQKK